MSAMALVTASVFVFLDGVRTKSAIELCFLSSEMKTVQPTLEKLFLVF